jgi:DNA-cytosine methyltransferase
VKILSLFDGISGAQEPINRLGITDYTYYASEIDKYAIKITQKNYPNTIQLGSVTDWKTWDLPEIDLLVGGSPCQGFSFAGKQLNFEDERSKLFFEFVKVLRYYKPKYFLLENVKMKKEYQQVITELLGVEPIEINSALVSAQNRRRLYWTNIEGIKQPEDKHIYLKDIVDFSIDLGLEQKYSCVSSSYTRMLKNSNTEKGNCITATVYKGMASNGCTNICYQVGTANLIGRDSIKRIYSAEGKIAQENYTWRKLTPLECERLQTFPDGYTDGLSNTQRYKALGNSFTVEVIAHILEGIA